MYIKKLLCCVVIAIALMSISGCSNSEIEHDYIKLSDSVCANNGGILRIISKNFLNVTYDVRAECNNGAIFKLSNHKKQ